MFLLSLHLNDMNVHTSFLIVYILDMQLNQMLLYLPLNHIFLHKMFVTKC